MPKPKPPCVARRNGKVEIFGHAFGFDAVFGYVLFELFVTMFALRAARDLYSFKQQVVRFGELGLVVFFME